MVYARASEGVRPVRGSVLASYICVPDRCVDHESDERIGMNILPINTPVCTLISLATHHVHVTVYTDEYSICYEG